MVKPQSFATHQNADVSPKKLGVVMNLIRGANLEKAKIILTFDKTQAAKMLLKVLKSAEANAKNNHGLNPDNMYVSDLWTGQAKPARRPNFGARGRYSLKVTRKSHIYVGLSEVKK